MPDQNIERRTLIRPVELRSEDGTADNRKIRGYFAVYGQASVPINDGYGEFIEVISPGAFDRSLAANPDVVALFNHDTNAVLGRTSSGTPKITPDAVGGYFELEPCPTTYGKNLEISLIRGDIQGCSFGFTVPDGGDEIRMVGDTVVRTLKTVDLLEITVGTAFPAYTFTSVHIRYRVNDLTKRSQGTPLLDAARRELILLELGI